MTPYILLMGVQWVYGLLSGHSRLEVYGGSIVLLFVLYIVLF